MNEEQDFFRNTNSNNNKLIRKSILISFFCGLLGSTIIFAIVLGLPNVKNNLFKTSNAEQEIQTASSSYNIGNLEQISLTNYSDTAIYAADKVLPSIVGISVEYNVTSNVRFQGIPQSSTGTAEGSGIIISEDGYILTNNHIINGTDSSSYYSMSEATSIKVSLYGDDTKYDAKIIGSDSETDLAVIKIEKIGLTKAELGDSKSLKVGEFAMAIGNPLGMQSSVSSGIISAVNREVSSEDGTAYVLIQTDAAINSGNSGGALVNSKGQVIGINTLKLSGTGIEGMGFAIPINDTIDIYQQLIETGKIARPYIGIEGVDIDSSMSERYNLPVGIYVKSVENFSSSEKSGLKAGDVILSVDDKEIKTMNKLNEYKKTKKIGDEIKVKISRLGQEMELKITLSEKP